MTTHKHGKLWDTQPGFETYGEDHPKFKIEINFKKKGGGNSAKNKQIKHVKLG